MALISVISGARVGLSERLGAPYTTLAYQTLAPAGLSPTLAFGSSGRIYVQGVLTPLVFDFVAAPTDGGNFDFGGAQRLFAKSVIGPVIGQAAIGNAAQALAPAGITSPRVPGPFTAFATRYASYLLDLAAPTGDGFNFYWGAQGVVLLGIRPAQAFGAVGFKQPHGIHPTGVAPPVAARPWIVTARAAGNFFLDLAEWPASDTNFPFGNPQRLLARGFDAQQVGQAQSSNAAQALLATGWDSAALRTPLVTPLRGGGDTNFTFNQGRAPTDAANLFFQFFGGRELSAAGIAHTAFGVHQVATSEQHIGAGMGDTSAFGDPALRNGQGWLGVKGITPGKTGDNHGIWNKNKYVFAGVGRSTTTVGAEAVIFNRNRYYKPSGVESQAFGGALLQGGEVETDVRGHADLAMGEPPRISHGLHRVSPGGMGTHTGPTEHQIGFLHRTLSVEGFVATRWGARIIPEIQALYPSGFAEAFGQQQVVNSNQHAAPTGIGWGSAPGEDYYRFGYTWVRLMRAIITPLHEAGDGLSGDFPPRWTSIINRNRTLQCFSTGPAMPPRPNITHGARALGVKGVPAPVLTPPPGSVALAGKALVAYRVRTLTPTDPIEPWPYSRWTQLRNAGRLLGPAGIAAPAPSVLARVFTNRRAYKLVGFENSALGLPMISDRVREINAISRFGIAPPPIPQHNAVKLYTRYLEPRGIDGYGTGGHHLSIHWTTLTPRWNHLDFLGYPSLKNLTPELRLFGHESLEWGAGAVRTQWRNLAPSELYSQAMGRPLIERREKHLSPTSLAQMVISDKVLLTQVGGVWPIRPTVVAPRSLGVIDSFGEASMNWRTLAPGSIVNRQSFGEADLRCQGIRVSIGIPAPRPSAPSVSMSSRRLQVTGMDFEITVGDSGFYSTDRVRLSPHTIYAPDGDQASDQALVNHEVLGERIDEARWAEADNGADPFLPKPLVRRRGEVITPHGLPPPKQESLPDLSNKNRHLIIKTGIRAYRAGVQRVLGARALTLDLDDEGLASVTTVGKPVVAIDMRGWPRAFNIPSLPSTLFGAATEVQNRHRALTLHGLPSLTMGLSHASAPYQWQDLHVGPPMPTQPVGIEPSACGTAWISHYVREISAAGGIDAAEIDYSFGWFEQRMRVKRGAGGGGLAHITQRLAVRGVPAPALGVPEAWRFHHFIRPDGNAEMYRKGAPARDPVALDTALVEAALLAGRPPPQGIGASGFGGRGLRGV